MQIPAVELKRNFLQSVENIVGPEGYSIQSVDRLNYCRDANFRSAIQAHYSHFENFPAIIVWPANSQQIALLIKTAIKHKIALTPYGGGSGVCGGAVSYNGGMIVDVKRMQNLIRLDEERLFVDVEAGILGLQLEKELQRKGFTLGHFPASILSASLGGYLATRSAGQLSSKYGKIEDMIIDLEFVDGSGLIHQTADISRSRGFDFTQAIVGSEGTLGVITKARLKIWPLPEKRIYRAISFGQMGYGIESLRRIMQTGIKPDVMRLYDELDSALMFARLPRPEKILLPVLPGIGKSQDLLKDSLQYFQSKVKPWLYRFPRFINQIGKLSWLGNLLIVMLEGHAKLIDKQLQLILRICHDMSARDLGEDPAQYWHQHRYAVSYKASQLFQEGAFTDTMEVATTWDNLMPLYRGVSAALKSHCILLAHISHIYPEGAAIYFTFVAPLTGLRSSLKTYDRLWQRALSATQKYGGVISHHHGIGRLKTTHIRKEWEEAKFLYQKMKDFFDPHLIMNPDVLLK